MAIYKVQMLALATAYIKASSRAAAEAKAVGLNNYTVEVERTTDYGRDDAIPFRKLDITNMPDVSFDPLILFCGVSPGSDTDIAEGQ